MGNSEVGHLNLGAGRVVPQDIVRISQAIDAGAVLRAAAAEGIVRDRAARRRDAAPPVAHRNGRRARARPASARSGGPRPPRGRAGRDSRLARRTGYATAVGAAVHARAAGADRDPGPGTRDPGPGRVDRDRPLLRDGPRQAMGPHAGSPTTRWCTARASPRRIRSPRSERAYESGETDEFVKPRVITGAPRIRSGDGVFCVNFRADRMRQMCRALAAPEFDGFADPERPRVSLVTMTQYDQTFPFPGRVRSDGAAPHRRRGAGRPRQDDVAHRGDREVRPRDVLLQRRRRDALPGRGAAAGAVAAGSPPTT